MGRTIKKIGLWIITLFILVDSSLPVDYYKYKNTIDKYIIICYTVIVERGNTKENFEKMFKKIKKIITKHLTKKLKCVII